MALTVGVTGGCSELGGQDATQDDGMAPTDAGARRPGRGQDSLLPADFELGLSDAWACGDLLLHVANPDRSVMLTLYWPRLLDRATPTQTASWEGELGGPGGRDVAIVVHTGTRLDAGTCARDGDAPAVIDQTWTAVAEVGRLGLDSADSRPSRLSAWLWDVELQREGDGARVVVEQLEQLDVELTS